MPLVRAKTKVPPSSPTCCSASFLWISSLWQMLYTTGLASSASMRDSHVRRLLMFLSSCCTVTSVSFSFLTLRRKKGVALDQVSVESGWSRITYRQNLKIKFLLFFKFLSGKQHIISFSSGQTLDRLGISFKEANTWFRTLQMQSEVPPITLPLLTPCSASHRRLALWQGSAAIVPTNDTTGAIIAKLQADLHLTESCVLSQREAAFQHSSQVSDLHLFIPPHTPAQCGEVALQCHVTVHNISILILKRIKWEAQTELYRYAEFRLLFAGLSGPFKQTQGCVICVLFQAVSKERPPLF